MISIKLISVFKQFYISCAIKQLLMTSHVDSELRKNLRKMSALKRKIKSRIGVKKIWTIRRNVQPRVQTRIFRRKRIVLRLFPDIELVFPDFFPELIVDGKDVALGGEQVLFAEPIDRIVGVEEQVEVFAGFGKKKRFLPILQCFVLDVVHGCVATLWRKEKLFKC